MLYTFAGTSVLKGELKFRVANSESRAKQLSRLGDTDVNIVQLPTAMSKEDAVKYLLDSGFVTTDTVRAVLQSELATKKPARTITVRVKKAVKVKAQAKAKPTAKSTEPTEEEVDRLYEAVYGTPSNAS
jgi:hypothetical protein